MPAERTLDCGARIFLPFQSAGEMSGVLPKGLRSPPSWIARPTRPSFWVHLSMLAPMGPPMILPSSP